MIKPLTAIFVLALLTGCAASYQSQMQTYRPANTAGLWKITGAINTEDKNPLKRKKFELSIFVNDVQAIIGELKNTGYGIAGDLSGEYENHLIESTCSSRQVTSSSMEINCIIFVDNERAATLTF